MSDPMQQATTPPQPYRQTYSPQPTIEGVQEKVLKHMAADEGDFAELFRLTERGTLELFPEFQLRQINRTRNFPNSIKAWHLHERQDEIWYVPPYHQLTMGLWDVRPNSPTYGLKYKRVLGGGFSKIVLIPRGVAHGCANYGSHDAELFYFVSNTFDLQNPDELRLHWDAAGTDFWVPERD